MNPTTVSWEPTIEKWEIFGFAEWITSVKIWEIFGFAEWITVGKDGSIMAWVSGMNPYPANDHWTTDVTPDCSFNCRFVDKIIYPNPVEWWESAKFKRPGHLPMTDRQAAGDLAVAADTWLTDEVVDRAFNSLR